MRFGEKFNRLVIISRGELPGSQISAGGGRVIAQAFGQIGHGDVTLAIFGIDLRDAHKARQRIFSLAAQFIGEGRGHELFDGLFRAVLLLQKQGESRDAFRRLLVRLQKAHVKGDRLGLFPRGRQAVKEHSVVNGRPVRPLLHREEVAQRLHGFKVIGSGRERRLIGLDGLVDAALLDEALGLFQLFDDVHAHAGSDGFPM